MPDALQRLTRRAAVRGQQTLAIAVTIALVLALVLPGTGPQPSKPSCTSTLAVAKLAGRRPNHRHVDDRLTLANCHSLSRLEMDYVYVDMEHGPLNLEGLAHCVTAMVDKAWTLRQGNAKQKVALFARFPPYGHDLGVMRGSSSRHWT